MGKIIRFPKKRHAVAASSRALKPNTTGDASRPREIKASRTIMKQPFEIRPRLLQLLTADVPTPHSSATLAGPPSASITSSTESSMESKYSRFVESSTSHVLEIATSCEQWLNSLMISERHFHEAVGARLKRLRLGYGETQATFAGVMGVGASALSNYEAGDRAVNPFSAYQLKNKYNAPLEWLYCGDESTIARHVLEKINNPPKRYGTSDTKISEPDRKQWRRHSDVTSRKRRRTL